MFNIPENVVGVVITGVFGLIVGIIGAIMARRGQKLGNRENRAPDVQEMWAQQESDRRMRQMVEDLWWNLRRAFQSYYRRVMNTVAKLGLDPKPFELTAAEQKAIDASPPAEK